MFFPVKKDKSQPQQIHIQPTELPMQIVNKQAENTTDAGLKYKQILLKIIIKSNYGS